MKPGEPLRRTPLQRKTELQRGGPLARHTPLRTAHGAGLQQASRKPRRVSASTVIPREIKDAVDVRDQRYGQPQCQRCGHLITGWFSRHHRDPRAMGGSTANPHALVNLVLLCGSATSRDGCHYEVESKREQAKRDGWLVPMGIRPEDWPVRRFGRDEYQLPGETGWTTVQPHPLQIEMGTAA